MAYNPKSKRTNPKGTPQQIKSLNGLTANKNIDDIRALSKISNSHDNSIDTLNSDVKIINGEISSLQKTKQDNIKLTTIGTSGPATLSGSKLNIPDYSGGLGGFVPYIGATQNVDLGEFELKAGQIEFDQTPTGTPGIGVMRWNDQDGTVDLGLKGGNVTLQIGQEQVTRVVNKTGINLLESNYQAVRISGAQGNRLKVDLAQANNDANSAETLGIVTETINNNQEGFITTSGLVRNINTTGSIQGETWADGDMLYLSGTIAGQLTNIKPTAPIHTVIMGYVVRAHATQGQIYVKVDNGYELDELHNVAISSPLNNQGLFYETATQLWKNKDINTVIGYTPVPTTRTLTINGTTYDLSANRTWSVGTVTSIGTTGPITGGTITGSGTIGITQATASTDGYLSSTDWNTFNSKQPAGNYITALSGEASGSGPGTASVTLNNASVTAKVLTGVNITGGSINASDSILTAFGKLQNQINGLVGSSIYQGTWNASTNTPALASGVGTRGYYYIVSVAGSTNLDGITDWNVGDWAIFDGTAWQQVDNTDSVTSVNGQTGAVSLTTDNISEGATNLYFTSLRARQSLSLTTSGSSGASTYNNTTGVLNVPNYTLSGLGGVPTSRTLTINGTTYDLSSDRSWSVGTVTSVDMTVPTGLTVTGSPITGAGTLALGLQSGYSIPTTANQSNWTTAYNRSIVSAAVNYGVATTSLVLTQQNTSTVTANLIAGAASQGKFVFFNGTNLAYTSLNASAPLSFDLNTYTFSISQAGSSTNGFLSSTDWNTFNNKQNAITLTTTGTSGPATLVGSTLNIPQYQSVLTNPVTGTGTTNYVARWTSSSQIGTGVLYDDGTYVGIGTNAPDYKLDIRSNKAQILSSDSSFTAWYIGNSGVGNAQTYYDAINGDFSGLDYGFVGQNNVGYMEYYVGPFSPAPYHVFSSGNVGIGTTSPITRLEVVSSQSNSSIRTGGLEMQSYAVNNAWYAENIYFDGSNWKLRSTGYATQMYMGAGSINFVRFATGNAGDSVTPVSTMYLAPGGNVGIGTSSPGDKLTVDGNINSRNTALFFGDGSDNSASIFATGGPVKFFANSSERMRITAAGDIGIGTTAPSYKLDVNGTGRFLGNASSSPAAIFNNPTGAGGTAQYYTEFTAGATVIGRIFRGNGASGVVGNGLNIDNFDGFQVRVNQLGGSGGSINLLGGNVGIGTTSPTRLTEIVSTSGAVLGIANSSSGSGILYGRIAMYSTAGSNSYIDYGGEIRSYSGPGVDYSDLRFYTANGAASTEKIRITSAGRVGIGTTAPGYVLEVNGGSDTFVASFINSSASQSFIRVGDSSDLNYSGLALYSDSGSGQMFKNGTGSNSWGGNASLNIYNSNGSIAFHPNNTANAMFIATSGNVGIATTAPSQKLHVEGNVRVTGAYYDSNNQAGTSGQILSSTGSGTDWVDSPTATATSVSQLLPNATVTYNWVGSVVNDTWVDVFTRANSILTTGTWLVKMYVNDFGQGGGHYTYTYSGTMTWYQDITNQTGVSAASEIELHRMGHAANDSILYLRTTEVSAASGGNGKLQIKGNYSNTSNTTITFTFVKIM